MGRALALLLPLCAALPHRHDVHSILDEIRALKSDIDADESPTLERRVYSNDEAAEEAEQHDDALASAPELEAGTAAAPNENAQWVTSMQIAVDKNLKGDIVAGFNLKPLTGAGAGAGATGTGGHFVSPATALGASWERTQQTHPAGAGAGVTRPTELVRFPVTLNTPLKAAGAEYWDLSAHEGKAGMRYHMKGGDTHFYKLRAAKELPGQRLAVVFSSRESSAANPSLERDEDGNVVASPAEELGIQWGHDADSYVGTDGTDASAADEPHEEEHGDEHGASLVPPGLERLGGGRNALAFSVSQLEQKMGGKKVPGGYSRFTMVATPGARRRPPSPSPSPPATPATHASDAAAAAAPAFAGRHGLLFLRDGASLERDGEGGFERQTTAVATPTDFRNHGAAGAQPAGTAFGATKPAYTAPRYTPPKTGGGHPVPGSFGSAQRTATPNSKNEVFQYQL